VNGALWERDLDPRRIELPLDLLGHIELDLSVILLLDPRTDNEVDAGACQPGDGDLRGPIAEDPLILLDAL